MELFEAIPAIKPPNALQVLGWWELRRIAFNFILFVVLIATWIGFTAVASPHLAPGEDAIEPMALFFFVPRYFLITNVCYTVGWIVELVGRRFDAEIARRRARWMFIWGTVFSCGITSLPFWYISAFWLTH